MSFYLRKSLKVGPIRFNFSKSGVGVSAGITGLRVGTGPRGNYVHMGRGGAYYRTTLPPASSARPAPSAQSSPRQQAMADELVEIESGSILQMTDSTSAELLKELNEKRRRSRLWPLTAILSVGGVGLAYVRHLPDWTIVSLLAVCALATIATAYWDEMRKSVVLFYDLEKDTEGDFEHLHDAFRTLASCAGVWHIEAAGNVRDRKYHAGANTLVKRKAIKLATGLPPYVKTNIEVPIFLAGRQTLYCFPDRVLVFESNGVGAINYAALDVSVEDTRFVEDSSVPRDAKVVDHTWQYVNRSGGPDRRFKDNRQLPVALYEEMHLMSQSGLNELFQFSKTGVGERFGKAVKALATTITA